MGLLLAFMMVSGHLKLFVAVLGGGQAYFPSLFFLPLILVGIALVYTLEGTGEARRVLGAIVITKALINILKWVMSLRLLHPDVDASLYGREAWAQVGLMSTVISTLAILLAASAIIVVYQAMLNAWSGMPVFVALTVALVAAMLTDAVVFAGLSGWLSRLNTHMVGKLTAGLAASLPAALYISWRLAREPADVRRGVLERGAFEIVGLRRQLSAVSADLSRRKEEFDHLKGVFGRYVVADVVDELLSDTSQLELGGEVRDVTILFSDIRAYSSLSEAMSPTQVIELLNRYFGAMSTVIDAERGTIIEFEGDAILAVFGAPIHQVDHADRATRTALAMQHALVVLNEEWRVDGTARHWHALGLDDFRIRIGVHSGEVVVGNIGSETRTKYAVIGDTVNASAGVEQLNKKLETRLLLTAATVARLQTSRDDLLPQGSHPLRAGAEPVEVYTIAGMRDADAHGDDPAAEQQ
jgi:class 3 adenylate cyclase